MFDNIQQKIWQEFLDGRSHSASDWQQWVEGKHTSTTSQQNKRGSHCHNHPNLRDLQPHHQTTYIANSTTARVQLPTQESESVLHDTNKKLSPRTTICLVNKASRPQKKRLTFFDDSFFKRLVFDTAAALHACPQWHSSLLPIHWTPSGWTQVDLPLPYMFLRTLHVISRHHRTKRTLWLESRSPFARRKNMCGASVRSSHLVCALVKFIMIGCVCSWVMIRFPPRTSQDTPFLN